MVLSSSFFNTPPRGPLHTIFRVSFSDFGFLFLFFSGGGGGGGGGVWDEGLLIWCEFVSWSAFGR